MIIKKIEYYNLNFAPVAERRMKASDDITVKIYTDEGVLKYDIKEGFYTDFRSGGKLVDLVLPWMSNPLYTVAVLIHDANYASQYLTFEESNNLFKSMLIFSGLSKFKAFIAKAGVSGFIAREAYNSKDKFDLINENKIMFSWSDK